MEKNITKFVTKQKSGPKAREGPRCLVSVRRGDSGSLREHVESPRGSPALRPPSSTPASMSRWKESTEGQQGWLLPSGYSRKQPLPSTFFR